MGTYLNPGNIFFRKALNSDVYVDKTALISVTNDRIDKVDCCMCVSRPRRFGKSMAADMLVAYYSRGCDSEALFAGLKAEREASFRTHLNQHNVIRLDVQRFLESKRDLDTFMVGMERAVVGELLEVYSVCGGLEPDIRLKAALDKVYQLTGEGFIFIIDEWDCVFRLAKEQEEIQKEYLDFLRGLFKGAEYVELAYMTGILPIKKYGEHSAINIFSEYSMMDPKDLGEYFGFTGEEVRVQCGKHKVDFTEMERWYDGYLVGKYHVYNPKSVVDALRWKEFQSYWTGTETYEALKVYINRNFDGLREAVIEMLGNGRCKINARRFQNDMTTFATKDDILTLLVHLGYLTYDRENCETFIPNREIEQEFLNVVEEPMWGGLAEALNHSESLLKSTWELDEEAVAKGMEAIHSETVSLLKYNSEASLTCTIMMAYYSAKAYYMNPIMELPTGRGFADVVYLPRRDANCPALVVELKWDKSAQGAIRQIKERKYTAWIEGYTGDILLVGINYDLKNKVHECVIERYRKTS